MLPRTSLYRLEYLAQYWRLLLRHEDFESAIAEAGEKYSRTVLRPRVEEQEGPFRGKALLPLPASVDETPSDVRRQVARHADRFFPDLDIGPEIVWQSIRQWALYRNIGRVRPVLWAPEQEHDVLGRSRRLRGQHGKRLSFPVHRDLLWLVYEIVDSESPKHIWGWWQILVQDWMEGDEPMTNSIEYHTGARWRRERRGANSPKALDPTHYSSRGYDIVGKATRGMRRRLGFSPKRAPRAEPI